MPMARLVSVLVSTSREAGDVPCGIAPQIVPQPGRNKHVRSGRSQRPARWAPRLRIPALPKAVCRGAQRHLPARRYPVAGQQQDSKITNSSTTLLATLLDGPGSCAAASCSGWWWLSDSVASSFTTGTLSKITPGAGVMSSSASPASSAVLRGSFGPCTGAMFSSVLFRFVPGCRLRVEQTPRSTCFWSTWAEQKAPWHWLQRWFPQSLHLLRCRPC